MSKYANGRLMFRRAGRFSRPPSLEQLGYPINKDGAEFTCPACGEKCRPVLLTWNCTCGAHNDERKPA